MTPLVSLLENQWLADYITAGKKKKSFNEKYFLKINWDGSIETRERRQFITTKIFVEKAKWRWEA